MTEFNLNIINTPLGRIDFFCHSNFWAGFFIGEVMEITGNIIKRFSNKYKIDPETNCWIWQATKTGRGIAKYGYLKVNKTMKVAHRISYEIFKGPIPDGLNVCHKCDVYSCVNPDHLFLGTQIDNMKDMIKKGRSSKNIGENNIQCKLSEQIVNNIRNIYNKNPKVNKSSIAREYNVTPTTICNIIKGKLWPSLF